MTLKHWILFFFPFLCSQFIKGFVCFVQLRQQLRLSYRVLSSYSGFFLSQYVQTSAVNFHQLTKKGCQHGSQQLVYLKIWETKPVVFFLKSFNQTPVYPYTLKKKNENTVCREQALTQSTAWMNDSRVIWHHLKKLSDVAVGRQVVAVW